MASIIEKIRGRKKDEKFIAKGVIDRLEEEGFKPLVKADVLEKRVAELKDTFRQVMNDLTTARTEDEKGKAIDKAHNLVFFVASPWLRSLENPWLAGKMNDFIEQYAECRHMPALLNTLLVEAKAVINFAYTNIDVEPLRPIIVQALSRQEFFPPWRAPMPEREGERSE